MTVSPAELERVAVDLAAGAADQIRAATGGEIAISAKSTSTDLVTDVDRRVEGWLVNQIATIRPADAILGEEGGGRAGTSSVRWLIDPIDGTVNFVLGIPQYAVSIAAEVAGTVVAGAVCNPASGELFRAHAGGGAWLGERRLAGPRGVPLSSAIVGTGFGYDREQRERQARVVAALLPVVADIRRQGAASLDLCALAVGRLDAYYEAGLNPWDYAAGGLIAAEAGCLITGLRARAPGAAMTAGAGPSCAAEFFAELERIGADSVL